ITGGVDLSKFSSTNDYKDVEKKYSLKGKNVVLFTGKITEKKGVEYLIKAAPKIDGEVFVVGGGDDTDRLKEIVKRRNIKNVHITGYIKNRDFFIQFYKRANVFVFPSIWDEPLGLVALEAMACGTPVVASRKGGIPLAVKDGYNGYLVKAKSSKQIADKVNKILANKALQEKLSKNARQTVEEKFDWSIIAKRFHQYYDEAYQDSLNRRKSNIFIPEEEIVREAKELKSAKFDI
nr:glycosyltransferase family 4 protein [Patescibacteria group bacterium]